MQAELVVTDLTQQGEGGGGVGCDRVNFAGEGGGGTSCDRVNSAGEGAGGAISHRGN